MGGFLIVDEGSLAKRLWTRSRNQSMFAMYTPYNMCLASGNLNSRSFLHCISQDLHFLRASVVAYEMAEDCADDDDDKVLIRKVRKRVLNKLKGYSTIVQEWGFELPKENIPDKSMVKYTEFLLATASGKSAGERFPGKVATPFEKTKLAAYTLAAMAPSMRLRAFLSKEIQALLDFDESRHIYRKWIDSMASQKFEASASQIEDLLDKLTVCLTGEELEVVEKIYHLAIQHEADFFSAQPIVQHSIVPLAEFNGDAESKVLLFCDFDMTCSTVDSSALLAETAIKKTSKTVYQLTSLQSDDLRTTWRVLSRQYIEEYEQCVESILLNETVEDFSYGSLCKALKQISDFEKSANTKVVESAVLKGLSIEDIQRAGKHLVLQDGCREFFKEIINNSHLEMDIHVLSYCWCGDLIRSAFSSGNSSIVSVDSNELLYDELITTGEISRKVESPMEKLQAFSNISMNKGKHVSVYIGGSVGDLLCLLKADIGILISPSSSLKRLANKFGISFIPLFSGLVKKQREATESNSPCWTSMSSILYTVSSWAEIHAFILGS